MTDGFTLVLDGSTYSGSVAVLENGRVVAERELPRAETPGRSGRDENFMPMVAAALEDAGVRAEDVARVVCGAGPGSFTSLRIAASIAKGIATGVGCPLYAVSSLALIVADHQPGRYLATLPAMRGEVYALAVDVSTDTIAHGDAAIIPEESAEKEAARHGAKHAAGSPHARAAARMLGAIVAAGPCDIDSWEPSYGRLAEAQVKWEAAHGRPLSASG